MNWSENQAGSVNRLQGFPNGIDWWRTIWAKWSKTAWKLQNRHFGVKTVERKWGDQLIFLVVGIFSPVSSLGETLDYLFFILQIIKTWIKTKAEFLPPPSSVYSPVLKTKWILHSSDSLASNLKLILSWTIGNKTIRR